jgi:hypothetical protein
MTRQEVVQLADRVAAATPEMTWFVVYHPSTNSYQVLPESESEVSGKLSDAVIVHVAQAAAPCPLPALIGDR